MISKYSPKKKRLLLASVIFSLYMFSRVLDSNTLKRDQIFLNVVRSKLLAYLQQKEKISLVVLQFIDNTVIYTNPLKQNAIDQY